MCLCLEEDTPRTLVLVIFVLNAKGRPNRAKYQLHYTQSIQIFQAEEAIDSEWRWKVDEDQDTLDTDCY